MSLPDRSIRHKDGIPHQRNFRLLMEELALATDPANLARITGILPSTLRSGEFFPQTVRQTFIETIRTQREEHIPQFASVNALLDVGRLLTPHLPQTWATLADIYREVRPLVDGIPDREDDRSIIIDKFGEFNKGMMRQIIGEQNETDDFSDKLKTAYLEAIAPNVYLTQSDLLTLLYVGEIIAAYLPQSPTTLSDIQLALGPRISQIELQMPFRRGDVYSIAYQKLLHAIKDPETTMPAQKPKVQVVFEQPQSSVEKLRRTRTRTTGRQKQRTPTQPRPHRPETKKIEFIIQDDVEQLRLANPGISKEEIAERLTTTELTVQPYQVKKAITRLIAAGRLESNKGFKPNPETAAQLAQVKALRLGAEYVSDAEIAKRLGVEIGRVHVLVDQLRDAGEIPPRTHPGKTGPTAATLALRAQIKAIKEGPEVLSQAEIAARVGKSRNYVKRLIKEMYASGELQR